MLDLFRPDLDFVALASGVGLASSGATTCEELDQQLAAALATPGPAVIDCVLAAPD